MYCVKMWWDVESGWVSVGLGLRNTKGRQGEGGMAGLVYARTARSHGNQHHQSHLQRQQQQEPEPSPIGVPPQGTRKCGEEGWKEGVRTFG